MIKDKFLFSVKIVTIYIYTYNTLIIDKTVAGTVFRRNLIASLRAAHTLANLDGQDPLDAEIRRSFPQLDPARRPTTPARPTASRQRRQPFIVRAGDDRRRNQMVRVRVTALDGPQYEKTNNICLETLKSKGLGNNLFTFGIVPFLYTKGRRASFLIKMRHDIDLLNKIINCMIKTVTRQNFCNHSHGVVLRV